MYAIKTIDKAKILADPQLQLNLVQEISIMRRLDHKYIMKLYDVYEDIAHVFLVLEYLGGGELFQRLQTHGLYSEGDAALAMACIFEALAYCHERGIIHRDLKPENLLLAYMVLGLRRAPESPCVLKIADFGLATTSQTHILETQRCGSVGYVAPEVLNNEGYDTRADVFSAGIILYIL